MRLEDKRRKFKDGYSAEKLKIHKQISELESKLAELDHKSTIFDTLSRETNLQDSMISIAYLVSLIEGTTYRASELLTISTVGNHSIYGFHISGDDLIINYIVKEDHEQKVREELLKKTKIDSISNLVQTYDRVKRDLNTSNDSYLIIAVGRGIANPKISWNLNQKKV